MTSRESALRTIKTAHTIVWALLVWCILAIPAMAWRGRYGTAFILIATVLVECLVLAANKWRCPLTDVAERYTDERRANFDIYLPLWLARYNKHVFGGLFVAGVVYAFARWRGWV